ALVWLASRSGRPEGLPSGGAVAWTRLHCRLALDPEELSEDRGRDPSAEFALAPSEFCREHEEDVGAQERQQDVACLGLGEAVSEGLLAAQEGEHLCIARLAKPLVELIGRPRVLVAVDRAHERRRPPIDVK